MKKSEISKYIIKFLPFWLFIVLFKVAACIHFNILSPWGARLLPIQVVGLVIGGQSLLQLVFDVPAGMLIDRFGYRRFLKITTILFIVAIFPIIFYFNKDIYIFTVLASSVGWLFFSPCVNAYVIFHSPKEYTARFFSLRDTFNATGSVISSVIFVVSLTMAPSVLAYIMLAIFFLAIVAISFAPKDSKIDHSNKKIKTQGYYIRRKFIIKSIKSIKKLNPAAFMLIASNLASSIFYSIIWFVIPLAISQKIINGSIDMALGVFDISILLTGGILGRIADKRSKKKLIFVGLLTFAIIGILLGFTDGILFLLLGFVATMGDESSSLSIWAWLNFLDEDHDADGLISSVVCAFSDLGWAIGPIIGGFLYPMIGLGWTIAIGGLLILSVWILYNIKIQGKCQIDVASDSRQFEKKPHHHRHKH